jgi:hypothetical protein
METFKRIYENINQTKKKKKKKKQKALAERELWRC